MNVAHSVYFALDFLFIKRRHTLIKPSLRIGVGMLLVGMMMLAACGTSSGGNATTTNPNKISLKELRLGLIPVENGTSEITQTQPFASDLSKALGIPVTLYVGTSYTATIEAEASGKLDAALYGALSYILANQQDNIQFLCRQLNSDGAPTYNSLIITQPNSGINSIAQLKGRTFSFVDPASTSGFLVPEYLMTQAGLNPQTDVKGTFAGSHQASLQAVLSGKVAAGAVASDTFAQLEAQGLFKASQIKVIATSFPIYEGPIAVPSTMSPHDRAILAAAFEGIKNQKDLQAAGIGGFVPGSDSDYNSIRQLIRTLNLNLQSLAG
jgi:phosphonate transport system substrate-binding protein